MRTYGLIIAAGNQTRFDSVTPKALVEYNGRKLLDINIEVMNHFCDKVYPVVSFQNDSYFSKYSRITIESGKGCGHAVMKALRIVDPEPEDRVFILWGDSYSQISVYDKICTSYTGQVVIPVRWEQSPYVSVVKRDDTHVNVLFSKYGEVTSCGYHDLSLFYGNANGILYHLNEYSKTAFMNKKHGNEMQFLDIFNYTPIEAKMLEVEDSSSFSFNTMSEFCKITGNIGI